MKFQLSAIVVAIITSSIAYADNTVLGTNATAVLPYSTAIGDSAYAENHGTAVGYFAEAKNGTAAAAYGDQAQATANYATALGFVSKAEGVSSVALGHQSHAQADNSTAVGSGSVAAAVSSTALGVNTSAKGLNSTALGADSRTETDAYRSTAIGSGSVATEAMTVSFGSAGDERRLVNIAAGTATTDAVNVSQLEVAKAAAASNAQAAAETALASAKAYTDNSSAQTLVAANTYTDDKSAQTLAGAKAYTDNSSAQTLVAANTYTDDKSAQTLAGAKAYTDNSSAQTLASANNYTNNAVAVEKTAREADVARLNQADLTLQANIDTEKLDRIEGDRQTLIAANNYTDQRINKLERGYQAAVAASIAIASLPQPTEAGKSMVSFGTGTWESEQGYAVGISGVTQNNKWVYKAAGTGDSRGKLGGGVSVGFQW